MIGIDIVAVGRIEKFIERQGKERTLKRFFDKDEILLLKNTTSIAGFYAAKEAVSKALGVGIGKICQFHDIKIYKDDKKAPYFTLSKHLIDTYEIKDSSLSITHHNGFAIAVAAIEGKKSDKVLFH